ncbi:MAG: OadG family protein [Oscillospiraceae bacterium]|jgi:Na+-transporting methylmalonyl-CoA/oxaloacetate decarboxylase gamma subunit|nr:OadG family protein [Oscillospiraceae bacterium]
MPKVTDFTVTQSVLYAIAGIAVVLLTLTLLSLLITLLSKAISFFAPAADASSSAPAAQEFPLPAKPAQAAEVKLTNTDEQTAALLMAIVAAQSEIPLNHLQFNSIKLLAEDAP